MITSNNGINLIKSFEGFRATAYVCPAGILTIGYGTTSGVKRGMVITEAQAEVLLRKDLTKFEDAINKLVKVPLTQNQFDALSSLVYNIGLGNLASSTLLKKLNEGDYQGAADQFPRWNRAAGRVLAGLTRRRAAERALWLET